MKRKNAEIHQPITDLSLRDGLTQLLNRRAVRQVLLRQESLPTKDIPDYAVIMLDIDKFKVINDQYGHNSGDSLLQSTAGSIHTKQYTHRGLCLPLWGR